MKIGIITDIHENVLMLREAFKMAVIHKCDEIACLGDIVGFDRRFYRHDNKRSAKECVNMVKSSCRWIVAGNHDMFAAARFPEYSNGFEFPESWFSLTAGERKSAACGQVWCYEGDVPNDLDENDIHFLKTLPEYLVVSDIGFPALFSHYIFPDLTGSTTRYIERNSQLSDVWNFMEINKVLISFSGHSHNHFPGFAYRKEIAFLKALNTNPNSSIKLGDEMVVIVLPPLAGESGRTGFSIIDSVNMRLNIISTVLA